tara:strand:+ start:19 stop:5928 length:5910 start_codon:yes stop_codon:yes gene_type:complete
MPLNKLENFIKNVEGRILYVSPSDLDSTDSITNEGNSLTKPFKTIQRALLEAARFSYVKGNNNDLIERTTILLMPGEHVVDNRPGFGIKRESNIAKAILPGPTGAVQANASIFNITKNSTFDLEQEDNILYKFNSVYGGVIVPRGTSIVGLDLRKTKIRPKYVPNPTTSYESDPKSAIFRITGTCYFWQFSVFDGDENGKVYTDYGDFSASNRVKPTFSHHKLTIFEYADGVNNYDRSGLTDLDMYYAKVSNAYNTASTRDIDQKFPATPDGFAKQRPEWEIVGAFADDPISITSIVSGDLPGVPSNKITVTTQSPHGLSVGTPIKIKNVSPEAYNVSTKVAFVDPDNERVFTYTLDDFDQDLNPIGNASGNPGGQVIIETDTVSGASPYIFNISMRSVYGMNGLHADGSKADGFRSMVVAQFTGVSLQKDDRAFVKYIDTNRNYEGNLASDFFGDQLAEKSSSTNPSTVYHLDSGAIYRSGWESCHIKMSNDSILQIVSVFAIGYNKHFEALSGGDASITNSNSNFGQLALIADGFKKNAFDKDDTSFITHYIPPKSIEENISSIDWLSVDVGVTTTLSTGGGNNSGKDRIYIFGFTDADNEPPSLTQGYKVGAKDQDQLLVKINDVNYSSNILMSDGVTSSIKEYSVAAPISNIFQVVSGHALLTGEKVILQSKVGDLPENALENKVYFAIRLSTTTFSLASSLQDANNGEAVSMNGGENLVIKSRVVDKNSGEAGSPIQFDSDNSQWYINTNANSELFQELNSLGTVGIGGRKISFINRIADNRSIDEKLYKLRVTIPKEITNAKNPESGFCIQESSTTGLRTDADFTSKSRDIALTRQDFDFDRNSRFISTCSFDTGTKDVTIISSKPHNLNVGDLITIKNVTDSVNTVGAANSGFNGSFTVDSVTDGLTFKYKPGKTIQTSPTNNFNDRVVNLPRFERTDLQSNIYTYRNIKISDHIGLQQDGIYHLIPLNASYSVPEEFTDLKFSQNVVDLYPQLDRDNKDDNPRPSTSFALRNPVGQVSTNDLKKSITRETSDLLTKKLGIGLTVTSVSATSAGLSTITLGNDHSLSGITTAKLNSVSSGFNNGTFYNVKILTDVNSASNSNWKGTLATINVTGGSFDYIDITNSGGGYSAGDIGYIDKAIVGTGGGDNQRRVKDKFDQNAVGLGASVLGSSSNLTIQVTGSGITTDSYYRLTSVPSKNSVAVAKTTGDSEITTDQYVIVVGQSVQMTAVTSNTLTTFTSSTNPHGLTVGNRFQFNDSANNNLGTFIVKSKTSTTVFTATTHLSNGTVSNGHVLKHAFSANNATSDIDGENLSKRGVPIYGNDNAKLGASVAISDTTIQISLLNDQTAILNRFPYGSYIQIEDEILRVSKNSLTGSGNNKITVIRGVLGTSPLIHANGSYIQKIKPIPIEFHRPSILRASGHTFEYLGYGPGNYSTALPQVQIKTLTEREEFLSQSQERSGGAVVYTGMNDKGDFYIGNNRKSALTGEEISFDVPIPTVTGADPSRLSVIFDEVTVKERLVVEGGKSNAQLSQFDGPVSFNEDVNIYNNVKISPTNNEDKESFDSSTGALVVDGGVGIAGTVNIGAGSSINLPDNSKLQLGDGNDLQIYHTSNTNSVIRDFGTELFIDAATTHIRHNVALAPSIAKFNGGGSVQLWYDYANYNDPKFETTASGVIVTGILTATNVSVSSSVTAAEFFGDGAGLTNTGSTLAAGSGTQRLVLTSLTSGQMTSAATDSALTYNSSEDVLNTGKLNVSGISTFNNQVFLPDGVKLEFGGASSNSDLEILHDGGNSVMRETGTGNLFLQSDQIVYISKTNGTSMMGEFSGAGGVKLHWNGSSAGQRFETTQTGVNINGVLSATDDIIAYSTSDKRFKNNISPIKQALDKVKSISGNTFDWNELSSKNGSEVGVIAQEIEALGLPGITNVREDGTLAVRYEKLVPVLVEAIKELSSKVTALENKINN